MARDTDIEPRGRGSCIPAGAYFRDKWEQAWCGCVTVGREALKGNETCIDPIYPSWTDPGRENHRCKDNRCMVVRSARKPCGVGNGWAILEEEFDHPRVKQGDSGEVRGMGAAASPWCV